MYKLKVQLNFYKDLEQTVAKKAESRSRKFSRVSQLALQSKSHKSSASISRPALPFATPPTDSSSSSSTSMLLSPQMSNV